MKTVISLVVLALFAATAFAADAEKKSASPAQLAQQEKMKACNAEATSKALKGNERKTFMSGCLGAKAAPATQQDKMKADKKPS